MVRHPVGLLRRIHPLQRLKERHHVRGVVTGCGHDLRSAHVRLRLQIAAVSQENGIQADAANGIDDLRGPLPDVPAEDPAEDADAGLGQVGFRGLMRAVTQGHVRNLVRHDCCHFAFIARLIEHAAVDVHESAIKVVIADNHAILAYSDERR